MKRIVTILSALLIGTVSFGWLRAREKTTDAIIVKLQAEQAFLNQESEEAKAEHKLMRKTLTRSATAPDISRSDIFTPALVAWLAAGDFSNIPQALVPELRERLGLPETADKDFVWVSKPTMQTLRPPSPRNDDKLPDSLCALLSIGPVQKTLIDSYLTRARQEFSDWAKKSVERTGPNEELVVSYTLPADDAFAGALTNQLLSKISQLIGTERTSLFRKYSESWFQIEMGYLGGVTNTLSVLKRPGSEGQQTLLYKLTRTGPFSSMSQGPGEIHAEYFPPAWKNIFPGGWQEVAQREGFSLPDEKKELPK